MPDLGKYAFSVLTSYGISFLLISCLVAYILYRNYRIRIDLEKEDKPFEEVINAQFSTIQENKNKEVSPRSHG